MFLSMLNNSQKQLFLGLAYNVAAIDGDYSKIEEDMMQSYCHEMQVEFELDKINLEIESIRNEINAECGMRAKKIIIFEVIGLAMSDNNYDTSERELIQSTMDVFGIPKDFDKACESTLNEYIEFQNRLNSIVIG